MRFGTFYFFQAVPWLSHDEVVHRELEQMEWTEELGFDQIWLTEHHFIDYGLAVDPGTLAAVAASRTRRVRIGLAAAILPFHHPLRLAEQTALVDIVSRGRLEVGFGRGNRPAEFRGYNVPQQENRDRFEEAVEIITQAWTQMEPFSYEGRFFTIRDTRVMPKPLQKPHPPVYQVCGSKESIEGTAARGATGKDQLGRSRARDRRLRLTGHRGAQDRGDARLGRGSRALLDELRRPAAGQDPPLDGVVRARGDAQLPRLGVP